MKKIEIPITKPMAIDENTKANAKKLFSQDNQKEEMKEEKGGNEKRGKGENTFININSDHLVSLKRNQQLLLVVPLHTPPASPFYILPPDILSTQVSSNLWMKVVNPSPFARLLPPPSSTQNLLSPSPTYRQTKGPQNSEFPSILPSHLPPIYRQPKALKTPNSHAFSVI
jgi:hypothetical protein